MLNECVKECDPPWWTALQSHYSQDKDESVIEDERTDESVRPDGQNHITIFTVLLLIIDGVRYVTRKKKKKVVHYRLITTLKLYSDYAADYRV